MMEQVQPISQYQSGDIDAAVVRFYRECIGPVGRPLIDRIKCTSHCFLGRPYLSNALGEGPDGEFDQNPLYRFDAFDCVTFVNTVIALVKGYDLQSFRRALFNVGYHHGEVDYYQRNHFMSVDWNVNNSANGFVRDVTREVRGDNKRSLIKLARTEINKPAWIQHKTVNALHLLEPVDQQQMLRILANLHAGASRLSIKQAQTAYLPLERLFDRAEHPIKKIWKQIPDGCIVEIVRPDWNLKAKIGTNMNISHLGFMLRDAQGHCQFRHASEINKCVTDVSLVDYLQQRLHSPTIKGINLQVIL